MTYSLTKREIVAIKLGVAASLKDPTSPLFGEFKASKSTDGVVTVCGMVNAKNSFGGYTGSKPFTGIVVGSGEKIGFVPVGFGSTEIATASVKTVCAKYGIFL